MLFSSSMPENELSGRRKLIEELVQGREIANQLQNLLSESVDGSAVNSAEDLVLKIMKSFSNTLFMLNRNDPNEAVVSQIQQAAATSSLVDDSLCLDAKKSEDSGESCRSVSTTAKNRRGCYKRRKKAYTWQRETSALIDDGHAWRKYGQKMILKSKHPRNYYRCTHKYDQDCHATKQVQKTQDDPPIFRTTYHGHHTCKNVVRAPELVMDCPTSPGRGSSALVSFSNRAKLNLTSEQVHPFFSSCATVKQEFTDDPVGRSCNANSVIARHTQTSASLDYIASPDHRDHDHDDLMAFDQSPGNMTMFSSNFESDIHGDVMSGMMPFDDDVFRPHEFLVG